MGIETAGAILMEGEEGRGGREGGGKRQATGLSSYSSLALSHQDEGLRGARGRGIEIAPTHTL